MRRIIVTMAVALLAIALMPTQAGAGVPPSSQVWFVHGIGNDPGDNPVDVYVRPTVGPVTFSLLVEGEAEGFDFGAVVDTGDAPAGDYDVLVCTAVANPADSILGCADNGAVSVNGNSGNPVTVVAGGVMSMFVGYGPAGRPAVIPLQLDLDCVETPATGRLTVLHGADAGPIDVELDEDNVVIAGLDNSQAESVDAAAATYDLSIQEGIVVQTGIADFELNGAELTIAFFTGDPDDETDYSIVTQALDLEVCEQPTTTSTTTTAPPPQALTQPRFTG